MVFMEENATIKGLLTFSEDVQLKKEVLGTVLPANISGVPVSIHFPIYPDIAETDLSFGISTPLLPPPVAVSLRRGNEALFWGYPMRHPDGDSCVKLIALSTNCEHAEIEDKAAILYQGIDQWGKSFLEYLILATKQNTYRENNIKPTCRLELIDDKYIPENKTIELTLHIPSKDSYASLSEVKNAIMFADSGKQLHIEYQMLLSAYRARQENQNRQAIIDACTAVELCLDSIIRDRIDQLGMSPNLFLDKFGSLGAKFDLVRQLDKTLPKEDYQTLIVTPRNDIAHNREISPSERITDALIFCAERCLQHFFNVYY